MTITIMFTACPKSVPGEQDTGTDHRNRPANVNVHLFQAGTQPDTDA
ncbi:hypothetical protein [Streptomyces sp. G-G2]|nr:hypothetical protein [Streptomyces sp. G-G2]MDJ0386432.1 hypothetical protein [Streptomyces sp. G-G2]